jgi:hypothetical protein
VIAREELERDAVIVACAVSAGVHAALTPEHFRDGTAAGLGFLVSAVVLAAIGVALTVRPAAAPLSVAYVVLAALLAAYALAVTTGLPLLHPEAEPVDGVAVFTKAVESLGLLAAAHLITQRKGTTT